MKKLICILLSVLMLVSVAAFVGCDKTPETPDAEPTLKMGLGIFAATATVTDATDEKEGQGKIALTAAVITVDAEGKVVACQLDTADYTVKYI